jgi:hypothetical protein
MIVGSLANCSQKDEGVSPGTPGATSSGAGGDGQGGTTTGGASGKGGTGAADASTADATGGAGPVDASLDGQGGGGKGGSGGATGGAAGSGGGAGGASGSSGAAGSGGSSLPDVSVSPDASLDSSVQDQSPNDVVPDGGSGPSIAVWTNRYDNARLGANTAETTLTVANVGGGKFGQLFSRNVIGQIYAQPLYLPQVAAAGGVHNVVYIATERNNVYAFDADDPAAGTPLWTVNLGSPYPLNPSPTDTQPVPAPYNVSCWDMTPETGITSTPVIDVAKGRMYVVAKSYEGGDSGLGGTVRVKLHALDVKTGAELLGGPFEIEGSVPGTGDGTAGGNVAFQARYHLNRPGLLLNAGVVYVAFASHCDNTPYHGWVFAYDAETLSSKGIYNTTANGKGGGVWQSGLGPSANADGVFVVTGNGSFDSSGTGAMTGLSVVKLTQSPTTLQMADFWTPPNATTLNIQDADYTTAAIILPQPNVIVMGGKDGYLNVLDPTNLGKYSSTSKAIQSFLVGGHVHGGPVYWQSPSGPTIYIWPEGESLKAFRFNGNKVVTTPAVENTDFKPAHPGAILSLSSNGSAAGTAVLWTTSATIADADAWHKLVPGVLQAYDATTLKKIWTSADKTADTLGTFAKFNAPTVVAGKVYVGTLSGALQVYGLSP